MSAHQEIEIGAFIVNRAAGVSSIVSNDRIVPKCFSEKNSSGTVIASGTYTYDSLDRRIGVDETSGGTTTQTWIVYNGNSNTPYAQFNGSGTLLERYLAGPSYVPGITGMIARTNASGVTDWYLTGKLGSVRDIVDTSGTVIDHISYGAFGSIRAETNPSSGSQFKFDGMVYDLILSNYYDNARYYNSERGSFLIQDLSGFGASDSNLYRFVNNSPLNFLDISGLSEDNPLSNPPVPSKSLPNIGDSYSGGRYVVRRYPDEREPRPANGKQEERSNKSAATGGAGDRLNMGAISDPAPPESHNPPVAIGTVKPKREGLSSNYNYPPGYYLTPNNGNYYFPQGFTYDKRTGIYDYPAIQPFWIDSHGNPQSYYRQNDGSFTYFPIGSQPPFILRNPSRQRDRCDLNPPTTIEPPQNLNPGMIIPSPSSGQISRIPPSNPPEGSIWPAE